MRKGKLVKDSSVRFSQVSIRLIQASYTDDVDLHSGWRGASKKEACYRIDLFSRRYLRNVRVSPDRK